MSDYSSLDEVAYHRRWLEDRYRSLLETFRVVVVTGARQTGKTTMVRRSGPSASYHYVSFDEPEARRQASAYEPGLWAGKLAVVLDEVQRVPEVLSAVKAAVDSDPSRRFVLTGSADLLLMQSVSESLAGRAAFLVLRPMSLGEWEGLRNPPDTLARLLEDPEHPPWEADTCGWGGSHSRSAWEVIARGLMPALLGPMGRHASEWWSGYVATYLDRDLRQLSHIDSLERYHRVMQMLALRAGGLLNTSEVARDSGVPVATVARWIDLMQTGHILQRLPAYSMNRTSRLMKMPKLHFADAALACFLAGHLNAESIASSREAGGLFEGLVCHHIGVLSELLVPPARLFHWRTYGGDEVDMVVEHGRMVVAVEVKATTYPSHDDCRGLRAFLRAMPDAVGLLVHAGTERRQMDRRLFAIPWLDLALGS